MGTRKEPPKGAMLMEAQSRMLWLASRKSAISIDRSRSVVHPAVRLPGFRVITVGGQLQYNTITNFLIAAQHSCTGHACGAPAREALVCSLTNNPGFGRAGIKFVPEHFS